MNKDLKTKDYKTYSNLKATVFCKKKNQRFERLKIR